MKLLIIATALFGACLAQGPPPREAKRYQPNEFQQENNFKPVPQQFQEKQPQRSHETTTYIPIIRFDKEQGEDGSYKTLWETGNNIVAQEEGFLKDLGPDPESKDASDRINAQVQQGYYEYTAPNGEVIRTKYTADETGFHVEGDHLPTPPPVSPEVQKGLDLIYAGIKQQLEQQAKEPSFEQAQGRKQNSIQQQEFNGNFRNQQQ